MENKRRVLVVSNNCFSPSNSNGRTLGNLFYGWPKECLAQMCVIAKDPAWDVCDKFFCIEDSAMLSAFLHGRKAEGRLLVRQGSNSESDIPSVDTQRKKIGRKTLPKIMLRELVWAHKRWRSRKFERWVNNFNPEVVVLQFGDSSFMIDIALYIAQSRQIPLVVYNTEGYYFFNKFWYYPTIADRFLFPIYKCGFHNKVKLLMKYASYSVYLNDELKEDYEEEFNAPSSVIYNSSSMQRYTEPLFSHEMPRICYLGGLGHGRDIALKEVGEVLQSINEKYCINVYGPGEEHVISSLSQSSGVAYQGVVSYDRVKKIIEESDILFHVEPIVEKDNQLRYAFSGKIADSIKSGKCFVLYAPKELACSKYVIDNQCGWFAETKDDLRDVLLRVINNEKERSAILNRANQVAQKNHSYEGNAHKFQSVLMGVDFSK